MAYLDAEDGRRVHYEHHRGAGRPVVLIHGWAISARAWDGTVDVLREAGHAVVAIDHRGCGRSDRDFADNGIAALAGDVVAIVDMLGLRGVVLNGWSLGGAVAAEAAARLGARAAGLVLTCGASPRYTRSADFPHGAPPEDVRALPTAMRPDRAVFFRGLAQVVCAKSVSPALVDWLWALFMESGPGVVQGLLDLADLDQRALLASLDIPLLSIVGTLDGFTPPGIGEAAAAIARHGELARFEGCGHAPFLEEPQAYHDRLLAFLGRIG